jgi:pimeloyl-ACP methyl ester carboxylesterase
MGERRERRQRVPTVAVDGGELHYEEFGNGPEVVLSGQWAFHEGSYQHVLARTSNRYRVLTITLRGYGSSIPRTPDLKDGWYDTWADDIHQVSQALGFSRFIYTGSSHGAGVGWHLALRHPEAMRGFVSVAGAPKDRTATRSREEILTIARARANGPAPLRPDWPQRPLPAVETNDAMAQLLEGIQIPTLLIGGAQDDVISLADTLRAAVSVKGATAVIYQDGKHGIGVDRAADIVRQFDLFVDTLTL